MCARLIGAKAFMYTRGNKVYMCNVCASYLVRHTRGNTVYGYSVCAVDWCSTALCVRAATESIVCGVWAVCVYERQQKLCVYVYSACVRHREYNSIVRA